MPENTAYLPPDTPTWCHDAEGTPFGFDQFLEHITAFHGYPAPGLIIGGKMMDQSDKGV